MEKENIILDKSFQFALEIINFAEILNANKKFLLSNQLYFVPVLLLEQT
jgi:neutral trehalase